MAKSQRVSLANRAQREGFARINDGLAIASIVGFASYITGHLHLTQWEAGGLLFAAIGAIIIGYILRKD